MEGKSRFCNGTMKEGSGYDIYSGTENSSCNACMHCPSCEGCFVQASLYNPPRYGYRKNKMFLFTMRDSVSTKYLVKVTPSPPFEKTVALNALVDECGFQDLFAHERSAPFFANVSGRGGSASVAVSRAIFSEVKEGIWHQGGGIKMFYKMNKKMIASAALFHYLFGSGDGQKNNVMYNEDSGRFYLIDTLEESLCDRFRIWHYGSSFYPGNFKYYTIWMEEGSQPLTDYQMYIPSGVLGTEYPPPLLKCLQTIASVSLHELQEHYALRDSTCAHQLQERALGMLDGFEDAIWKQFCKYFAIKVRMESFFHALERKFKEKSVVSMRNYLRNLTQHRCNTTFDRIW